MVDNLGEGEAGQGGAECAVLPGQPRRTVKQAHPQLVGEVGPRPK